MVFLLVWVLRRWNFEQESFQDKVNGFRFAQAHCTVESDREVVRRNITALIVNAGLGGEDNAIEVFKELVHREVPQHFHRCFGRVSVPYMYLITVFSSYIF